MTDDSAAIAAGLQSVCDALNTFDAANDDMFITKMPPPAGTGYGSAGTVTVMPGLAIRDNEFVIDLKFIRDYEKNGNANFLPNNYQLIN